MNKSEDVVIELPSAESVEDRIRLAIRTVKPSLQNIPLDASTPFDNLGLESIERTTVVFEIEEGFGISIVDNNLDTFETIGEARDCVLRLLDSKERRRLQAAGR